jgi:hypothetical protein
MAKLPYYMQNTSHENEEEESDSSPGDDGQVKAEGEGSVVVEEPIEGTGGDNQPPLKTEKKKYKVGKVEVDPKIGALAPSPHAPARNSTRTDGMWTQ